MILEILDTTALTTTEIARSLIEKCGNRPEVQKWKGNSSDVARYVVARRLTFLKNRKYVEPSVDGKWKLVRKTPLRNEVILAKSVEWELSPEDTVYKLLDLYIEKDKEKWQDYVKESKEREKSLKILKSKLEESRKKLREVSPI